MCVVSMIGQHYQDKWKEWTVLPGTIPNVNPSPNPNISFPNTPIILKSGSDVTREEFDELKKEVLEMKELLLRAKKYDEDNNEPHCEMDEKVELLKKIAEAVGVNLEDVFGNHK